MIGTGSSYIYSIFCFQMLMSVHLRLMCVLVKQTAPILREGLAASVHSGTLVMEGVMAMDVQVSIHVS